MRPTTETAPLLPGQGKATANDTLQSNGRTSEGKDFPTRHGKTEEEMRQAISDNLIGTDTTEQEMIHALEALQIARVFEVQK